MRALITLSGLLALGACAGGPSGDVATYDSLKLARAACTAKGEDLVLVKDGDRERMSAYECKRK